MGRDYRRSLDECNTDTVTEPCTSRQSVLAVVIFLYIIPSTPFSIAATKPKTGKQDQEKGIGICKESQSIH
jgi:hypothetical protein